MSESAKVRRKGTADERRLEDPDYPRRSAAPVRFVSFVFFVLFGIPPDFALSSEAFPLAGHSLQEN